MSLQNYITIDDVTNKIFNKFSETTRQIYVDKANDEIEDLAKVKGVEDLTTIHMPLHNKLKDYAIHYAISQLALDNIGLPAMPHWTDALNRYFKEMV